MKRLPIVGVMGSGRESYSDQAARLGRWLAKQDVHLLTGGGGGVMGAVSRAFYETPIRTGLVIGIVPGDPCRAGLRGREGYPNPWVEIPIFTHLALSGARGTEPMSRNHINVLSSDVLIALPGGPGTASEVELAVRYERPIVAYVRGRDEIPALAVGVRVEGELEAVQEFVLRTIRKLTN